MKRLLRPRHRRRGVTAYAVVMTVAILAILSYNLVHQALMDYRYGALLRDTIALQQLTDSARAQALHFLNRNDEPAAIAPVREPFGEATLALEPGARGALLRVIAHVPNAVMPRSSSQTLFRLERRRGRWLVVAAENGPVPSKE